jgi:uncharacterized membrane protein (UPF0127 family)
LKRLSAALVLLIFLIGCDSTAAPSGLRTVKMAIGSKTYTLEVADTVDTRQHGLMERDSMPADHGMIFVFPDVAERGFWMKHTRFPLEILYVGENGRVVHWATMQPYDLTNIPSNEPAKYAIELNVGSVKDSGVKVGDVLSIPSSARDAKE